MPPNPNALTPARRTPHAGSSQSRADVATANGMFPKSMFGLGLSNPRLGGMKRWRRASAAFRMPAAPAAALRWPMFDLTEPSAIDPGFTPCAANTSESACTSTTSPTRVEVPCPSTREHVEGESRALSHARWTASFCPAEFGAVMPFPFPSLDPPTPRITP